MKKSKLLVTLLFLFIGIVFKPSIVEAETTSDGFVIEDGVLTDYTGSTSNIILPDNITSIGDSAFASNESITSVTISNGVTTIGNSAFEGCISLVDITIPDSVHIMGEYVFRNCESLSCVTLPNIDNIEELGIPSNKNILIVSDINYADYTEENGNIFMYQTLNENDLDINLSEQSIEYTGSNIEPTVQIQLNDFILDPSYYTVSYENNVEPGEATVVITGTDIFNNTKISETFYITKESAEIVTDTIYIGNIYPIKTNTDEELLYSSSNTNVAAVDQYGNIIGITPGTATITVSAINDIIWQPVSFDIDVKANTNSILLNNSTDIINVYTSLGKEVNFYVESDRDNTTYKWYKATDTTSDGIELANATESIYTIDAESLIIDLNNTYYYCVMTNENTETITSCRAKLSIQDQPTNPIFNTSNLESYWASSKVTIDITNSTIDESTENVGYKYSIDNGNTWLDYTKSIEWETDTKAAIILAYAYNKTYPDIKSDIVSLVFGYDSISPVVNFLELEDFILYIDAIDDTSKILEYALIDTTTNETLGVFDTNEISIDTKGTYKIALKDNAGNITYTESFEASQNPETCEHSEATLINVVEPTCCEYGYSGDMACSICEYCYEEGYEIENTSEHELELLDVREATCESYGYTGNYYCKNSGNVVEEGELIEMLEHNSAVLKNQKDPTCCEMGYSGDYYCSNGCDEIQIKGQDIAATVLHNLETRNAKEATCSSLGYTGDTYCANSNKLLMSGTSIEMTKHDKDVVKDAVEPTCSKEGYTGDLYCSVCDTLVQTGESITTLPHDSEVVKDSVEPTCCTEGYTGDLYCSACDTFQSSGTVIEATGEHITEIRNQKETSCKEKGYTGDTYCVNSNKLLITGTDIDYAECDKTVVKNTIAPTCCSEGYTGDLHCSVCDKFQDVGSVIPICGEHTTEIRDAEVESCIYDGYTGDIWCTVGNRLVEYGTAIPADKCNKELVKNYKEPTCCADGYTGDLYCNGCKGLQEKGTVSKATGEHDEDIRGAKEATCTEDGYTGDIYCKYSSYLISKGNIIEALKHDTDIIKDTKDSTCGVAGYTGDKYCSKCNTLQEKGTIIEPTGNHDYDMINGIVTKEATVETEGSIEYKCKNCDSIYTETIAKLPEIKEEPTIDNSANIKAAKAKKATISKVTNNKNKQLVVKLKKASGYKFEIKISTDKKFKKSVKTYKTSKTSYTIKKLKKDKKYYVRVRTYKKIDGKTYYGKWSSIKSVKIKK